MSLPRSVHLNFHAVRTSLNEELWPLSSLSTLHLRMYGRHETFQWPVRGSASPSKKDMTCFSFHRIPICLICGEKGFSFLSFSLFPRFEEKRVFTPFASLLIPCARDHPFGLLHPVIFSISWLLSRSFCLSAIRCQDQIRTEIDDRGRKRLRGRDGRGRWPIGGPWVVGGVNRKLCELGVWAQTHKYHSLKKDIYMYLPSLFK